MSARPSTSMLPDLDLDLDLDLEPIRTLVRPVQAAAFWAAVALPLAYLPALAFGFEATSVPVLVALLAANATALIVGHGYNRDS